ncbi:thiamine-phosphate kinase [bacterium]|nr:thiamine-phosphate kinase [bacterium]
MKIESIGGEFSLIHRISEIADKNYNDENLILSIGDDAAVYTWGRDRVCVHTTDTMVESVHFNLSYTSFRSLGWKAAASNLSDIAAMGADPAYALVNIGIPDSWSVDNIEEIYRGMTECLDGFECRIIGGDTVRSPKAGFVTISVVGFTGKNKLARRDLAQTDDVICVTGSLGGSRTGLEVLENSINRNRYAKSVKKFLTPVPQIEAAKILVDDYKVRCMIDISDGLASEIAHICNASRKGCAIYSDKIPVSEEAEKWAKRTGSTPLDFALSSGEEYELVFTISPKKAENLISSDFRTDICPVSIIGSITSDKDIMLYDMHKKTVLLETAGWNHFSS